MQLTMFNNTEKINLDRPTEPPQKFDVIYCDPPWDYDGRTFLDGKTHETGSASDHYPTMSPDELKQMNVIHLCADKCICYMWTTGPQLDISIEVLKAWGFKYKTIAFVWNKGHINPGYYTLSSVEICIVGTRNAIPKPRGTRNDTQQNQRNSSSASQGCTPNKTNSNCSLEEHTTDGTAGDTTPSVKALSQYQDWKGKTFQTTFKIHYGPYHSKEYK